ncbi:sigma 54-interacting transcriptional regulator [bacterium]|nr:sigma 54-interacting transcriptional regulator [bacterium]
MKSQPKTKPLGTTEIILESISDGVFTIDHQWRITSFNRGAETITGIGRAEAVGRRCSDVFRASMCEADCALKRTMETGAPIVNCPAFIVDAHGRRIPISVSTALLKDGRGHTVGGVETFRDLSLVEELRKELAGRYELGDMVSRSSSMRRIFEILPQVAASDSTVLIQGETGTGKEVLARAIHNLSSRKNKPFVAINCGALPENLLESELFGYVKGAFTGADKDKPGRFALAEGGTLLLDEIGDLSSALQVKLLRVLQERAYEPLGGTKTLKANVRILAASNRDLAALVKKGAFRQDLFYRIHVIRLELPPLKRRKEDLPGLVERFVQRFNVRQGRTVRGVTPQAMALLMAHDWPGNIRELENVIEHAFILCDRDLIEPRHLPEALTGRAARQAKIPAVSSLRMMEAQIIRDALAQNGNNRLAAARALEMHKSTFFRKIKALGVELPPDDGRTRGRRK